MPIITPCYPQQNSSFNVTVSSRAIMQQEFTSGMFLLYFLVLWNNLAKCGHPNEPPLKIIVARICAFSLFEIPLIICYANDAFLQVFWLSVCSFSLMILANNMNSVLCT
jgi:hypothetical protein